GESKEVEEKITLALGAVANQESDLLIGRTLGEFTIHEKLGEGGFGVVYRAEQLALAREAVVKVMHASHSGTRQVIERFMREARLASRLEHPYTAHVYAFGAEPDGLLWIAMELVRGTPLDKLLETQGPLSLERFVPLLDKICEVVHTAHEQGIIHRDLKPANVMVIARAGRLLPKLLDFGIAKLLDAESSPKAEVNEVYFRTTINQSRVSDTDPNSARQTDETTGQASDPQPKLESPIPTIGAIGSPTYMPADQWANAAVVELRTDIYTLGVLTYEAISGHPPFQAPSHFALAYAHTYNPVPPLGSTFPAALDAVMAKV